jgi:hypothetical protein
MMIEFVRKSRRVFGFDVILQEFGTFEIQRLYMRVFNKIEREFLEKNWRDQGIRQLLQTDSDQERLPENWFRKI